jgi:hypothetical protein
MADGTQYNSTRLTSKPVLKDPARFQFASDGEQVTYEQRGLDYVSNLPFVNKRDAAGNLVINGTVQPVTDEEAAGYNESVILELNDRLYTNSSVTRAIDTQFKYFKFPPTIISRQTDIGEIDVEIPEEEEGFDPFSARYTPDPEGWFNFPYGGGADVWSATNAGDGQYTSLEFDYILKGPQQSFPKRYTITPEMIETGKDLRITYKVPVHNNMPPGPDVTVDAYSPARVAASVLTTAYNGVDAAVAELTSIRDVFNGLVTTASFNGGGSVGYTYAQIVSQYQRFGFPTSIYVSSLTQAKSSFINGIASTINQLSQPVEPELNRISRESDAQGFLTGSVHFDIANTSFVPTALRNVAVLVNSINAIRNQVTTLQRNTGFGFNSGPSTSYRIALDVFNQQLATLVLPRIANLSLVTTFQNAQNIVTKSQTTLPNPNSPSIYFFTRLQRHAPDYVPGFTNLARASKYVRPQVWDALRGETIVRNQDLIPWSTWFVEGYSTKNNTWSSQNERSEGGFYYGSQAYFTVDLIDPE